MRKIVLFLLVIGFLVGGISQQLLASEKKFSFNFSVGTLFGTDLSAFEFLTLGSGVDFHLSNLLMISPEIQVWTYKFNFDWFALVPGVILNLKFSSFFAGGGVIYPFSVSGEGDVEAGVLALKLNTGFRTGIIRVTGYIITLFEDLFKYNLYGISLGLGF